MFLQKLFFLIYIHSVFVRSNPIDPPNNVYNNSEFNKTTPVMIAEAGYPVETHWVTTPDGYNLCLHRIPHAKNGSSNKKVVYLQHGILVSSSDWILFGPGNSLGYILADLGYDVWMGNARGTYYSRNHTTLNPDTDSNFWQFSWHEIGYYDLPTMIDYILLETGTDGIYYVGHSQGTTTFFVMTSTRPEYNEKIKVQISLAPIAYMSHMTSPLLRILSFWEGSFETLMNLIGMYEFVPEESFLHMLTEAICETGIGPILCENVLFAICGFSLNEMNTTKIPLIVGHAPAGASTKQILHYGQEISSGHFRQYDFGVIENLRKYGAMQPPDYDLSKVSAPVFLFFSYNDWLAGVEDVERLSHELGNLQGKFSIAETSFNHLDFTYGDHAKKYVYNEVVSIFAKN
ncbi:lipase 3-like [Diorhabda sublineata]|uniref:lipase 3-like n=1 Tax=Diorhabda sublineata TaxID=1163346 RepID=UPI0024E0BA35|nr:lipase 3-like [Diorhabda sublineata]